MHEFWLSRIYPELVNIQPGTDMLQIPLQTNLKIYKAIAHINCSVISLVADVWLCACVIWPAFRHVTLEPWDWHSIRSSPGNWWSSNYTLLTLGKLPGSIPPRLCPTSLIIHNSCQSSDINTIHLCFNLLMFIIETNWYTHNLWQLCVLQLHTKSTKLQKCWCSKVKIVQLILDCGNTKWDLF